MWWRIDAEYPCISQAARSGYQYGWKLHFSHPLYTEARKGAAAAAAAWQGGMELSAATKLSRRNLHLPSHNKSPHLSAVDSAGQMVSGIFRVGHVLKYLYSLLFIFMVKITGRSTLFSVNTKILLHWWQVFAWNTTHWITPQWRSAFLKPSLLFWPVSCLN